MGKKSFSLYFCTMWYTTLNLKQFLIERICLFLKETRACQLLSYCLPTPHWPLWCWGWAFINLISALLAGSRWGSANRRRERETARLEEEETCSFLSASCGLPDDLVLLPIPVSGIPATCYSSRGGFCSRLQQTQSVVFPTWPSLRNTCSWPWLIVSEVYWHPATWVPSAKVLRFSHYNLLPLL